MRFLAVSVLLLFFVGCGSKNAQTGDISQNVENSQFAEIADDEDFESEFAQTDDFDPLESYNRAMTTFNDAAIKYVMSPIATGYKTVVPDEARSSIGNFFNNIVFPIRFINNLLQGEVGDAFDEGRRFIINTTVGFLGFFDVAEEIYDIKENDEEFGQTLGVWGVPAGPHIVLPILGPSNLRDVVGLIVDSVTNPLAYYEWRDANMLENSDQSLGFVATETLNDLPKTIDGYKTITKDAVDLYPLLKNMYEQRRNALIKE